MYLKAVTAFRFDCIALIGHIPIPKSVNEQIMLLHNKVRCLLVYEVLVVIEIIRKLVFS